MSSTKKTRQSFWTISNGFEMTPIAKYNPNIFKRIQQETLSSYEKIQ